MLAALSRYKTVVPKRMQFDDEEWLCVKPEEYALMLDRIRFDEIFIEVIKIKEPSLKSVFENLLADDKGRAKLQPGREFTTKVESIIGDPKVQYAPLDEFVKGIAVADLRKARKQKKISQKQLAEMAGLTQPQVSNLEKDPTSASAQTLRKIAKALDVKIFI
jgi:DNA-binding XRE family transcriptional regulator